jgi:pyruvate,water dikinase
MSIFREGEVEVAGVSERRFGSPFGVAIPSACDRWDEMYAYHALFDEDRRAFEESRLWFRDALHVAEPLYPFDALVFECATVALNQANSRLFVVPPSLGVEYRILNGYVYVSPNPVTDEATLSRRAELFGSRAGYYYEHWDELYARWVDKVEAATSGLRALEIHDLPELEEESIVREGRGLGSSHALLRAYDRLLEGIDRVFQYHFEFLNLGYGAYLAFYERCREAFPDIRDQTVAAMVSGIDVLVLRPDDELRRLARLALSLRVADAVATSAGEDDLVAALVESEPGKRWLDEFERTKDPWFYFSCGTGVFHHHHRSWIDDLTLPIRMIGSYVRRLEAGEDVSRPYQAMRAERDRITDGYRSLLGAGQRTQFDESLALARMVFAYVEDHNFYIDHRYVTIFWNKVREFGALLARQRFLADSEDVFFLRHDEVRAALAELRLAWSSGGAGRARGPGRWPQIVERRRSIYQAMLAWSPPPALGPMPDVITDPTTVMLWGITQERLREWLAADCAGGNEVRGCAGSPGTAEGLARVLLRADQLGELEEGEILVAPSTSTSWTPVFHRIAAAVLDSGGVMSHAAIVAREYGLPAVVGTGTATKRIRTGDHLRVDADAGIVTIVAGGASEDPEDYGAR